MKWLAALYGRVSTDREEQQESIKVQKEALIKYALENSFDIISQYFDEGYSGTNFLRPGINGLKTDILNKNINLILVKDLSRIGRNNAYTLLFLDYLQDNNVRLITINDNYDSSKDEDDIVGIKTWFNERYSKEMSKKIKFALKHKKKSGEYLTAFAPYGYKKSDTFKNKLEIDYFAAINIRNIYDMYISGYGFKKIADVLQERGVPNPSSYGFYGRKSEKWDWTMIRKLITNPVYTGCSVQQKYYRKSFKSKKISRAPVSDWIIVENTHKPIIDKDTYILVQQILEKRKKDVKYRGGPSKPHLFSSFLYCHECGSPLYYKENKKNEGGYRCSEYTRFGIKRCSSHYISEVELCKIIMSELVKTINSSFETQNLINDVMSKISVENNLCDELKHIQQLVQRNRSKIEILYKDRLNGLIDEGLFTKLSHDAIIILKQLEEQGKAISTSINNSLSSNIADTNLSFQINKIINLEDGVDREILERLIKRIEIADNGDVLIYYNFSCDICDMEKVQ